MLLSIKYKYENELVLIRLIKGYGLLSRDGQIHSCNPYVKIELKYNTDPTNTPTRSTTVAGGHGDCSSPGNTTLSPKVETLPSSKGHKCARSISLLENYEQFKLNQLKISTTDHYNNIDKLDLAQTRSHVQEQQKDTDDSPPSQPLSFKHEVSTTGQSKVVWHTQNPEFDSYFCFMSVKRN